MGLFSGLPSDGGGIIDRRKYAGDFKTVEITDGKGRPRMRALYTGEWVVLREPVRAQQYKIWAALGLILALAAVYIRLMLLIRPGSGRYQVMAPLLLGLFPLMYMVMGAFDLPLTGKPMRRDQYMHGIIRGCRSGTAIAVCSAVSLTAEVITRAVGGDWAFRPGDVRFLVMTAVLLPMAVGTVLLLRWVDITRRENAFYEAKPL